MSQNYPVLQIHQNEIVKIEIKEEIIEPKNSLAVCSKISEVRSQMADFTKRLGEFKERSRLAREEVIRDYNAAVERELKMVDKLMKMTEKSFEEQQARWNPRVTEARKPCQIDESVLRKHFEDMRMIPEKKDYTEEDLKPNINQLEDKKLENKIVDTTKDINMEEERNELLDNISCEENMICGGSINKISDSSFEDIVLVEEKKENNNEESADEEGIVLIDTDSYEEYLTTNEEEENEAMIPNRNVEIDYFELSNYVPEVAANVEENILEKSGESCEEYFTTNEEDSEEYAERIDEKYEEFDDINVEEALDYGQFIGNMRKMINDEDNEDNKFEECQEKEETTSHDTKKNDNIGDNCDNEERPVVRRNVTCSLEMQLAKNTD